MCYVYLTEENVKLQKRGGRYVVGRNLEVVFEVPEESMEGLVLIGNIQVSSEAMTSLLKNGIPTTWLSHTGKFYGRLDSTSHVDVFRQRQQIVMQESEFYLALSRKIIAAKAYNQVTVLRRYNRRLKSSKVESAIKNILMYIKHIDFADSTEKLMGYEGLIARCYFSALSEMMPEGFEFSKRSKQPPLDPFNSMLSFGYTLLMYEIYTAVQNHGLNPYFGFMHKLKNHHPALVSDLMEEWRAVIVDSMALSLIHHHEILAEHFYINEETSGVYMNREGRAILINAYEKRMRTKNQYLEYDGTFRDSLNFQAGVFSQALMAEEAEVYSPIRVR